MATVRILPETLLADDTEYRAMVQSKVGAPTGRRILMMQIYVRRVGIESLGTNSSSYTQTPDLICMGIHHETCDTARN